MAWLCFVASVLQPTETGLCYQKFVASRPLHAAKATQMQVAALLQLGDLHATRVETPGAGWSPAAKGHGDAAQVLHQTILFLGLLPIAPSLNNRSWCQMMVPHTVRSACKGASRAFLRLIPSTSVGPLQLSLSLTRTVCSQPILLVLGAGSQQ